MEDLDNVSQTLLNEALDDDATESLLNFTTRKLMEMNWEILSELALNREQILAFMKKLEGYKYIDEMSELRRGTFIRWISTKDPDNLFLTQGSFFCEVSITDDGTYLVCKNHGFNARHFRLAIDDNLIFQKLTNQERVLLSALDHVSSETS